MRVCSAEGVVVDPGLLVTSRSKVVKDFVKKKGTSSHVESGQGESLRSTGHALSFVYVTFNQVLR